MHGLITSLPCYMETGLKEKLKRFLLLGEWVLLIEACLWEGRQGRG